MPGLLQADGGKLSAAVTAEFVCTFLFALFGGATSGSWAWANGIALAVLVYVSANVSGGHLNPAVTAATMLTGHTSISRALSYMVAQFAGAALASVLHLFLIPKPADIGCFAPAAGATLIQAFGWELLMTFLLVVTTYAVAVGEPSYGPVGPLVVGFSFFAAAASVGRFTGASLNPARTLGPALVFGCHWKAVPVYVLAELLGAAGGALACVPLYGLGVDFGKWRDGAQEAVDDARAAIRSGYDRITGHDV